MDSFSPTTLEIRWDQFEDFLYLLTEKAIGKYINLVSTTNWDEYFISIYKRMAKECKSSLNFKEIPEIPFIKDRPVFRGKIIRMEDWTQIMMR